MNEMVEQFGDQEAIQIRTEASVSCPEFSREDIRANTQGMQVLEDAHLLLTS